MVPSWRLYVGDVREQMARIPDGTVDLVVTSPPYWALRDYGTGTWEGGDPACAHAGRVKPRQDTTGSGVEKGRFASTRGLQPGKSAYVVPVKDRCRCGAIRIDRQLGLERTPEEYVAKVVDIFRAVRRVLRDDGSVFLNLGDTYITSTAGKRSVDPKYIHGRARGGDQRPNRGGVSGFKQNASFSAAVAGLVSRRNKRSVWTFPSRPFKGAHFACFPSALPELCIRAATSAYGCCGTCHAPYERILEKGAPRREQQQACGGDVNGEYRGRSSKWEAATGERRFRPGLQNASTVKARILAGMVEKRTVGWRPTCACPPGPVVPAVVLDPFAGTATTGAVALQLGRSFIGIELKEQYARDFARPRLRAAAPGFAREVSS